MPATTVAARSRGWARRVPRVAPGTRETEGRHDRTCWPQSFSASEVRLLIVPVPGFRSAVCLLSGAGRAVSSGMPGAHAREVLADQGMRRSGYPMTWEEDMDQLSPGPVGNENISPSQPKAVRFRLPRACRVLALCRPRDRARLAPGLNNIFTA